MSEYLVTWAIEVTAGSHREAAEVARAVHLDKNSAAMFYKVDEYSAGGYGSTKLIELEMVGFGTLPDYPSKTNNGMRYDDGE